MVVQVPFQISECTFYLVVCIWYPATAIFLISEQIWLYVPNSLNSDYLNSIFNLTQAIIDIHHRLLNTSRKNIIAIAKTLDL